MSTNFKIKLTDINFQTPKNQDIIRNQILHTNLNLIVDGLRIPKIGTVKRLINYNHDNNYNILVPSDLNPFDFPPDVYKKLTANDVAYIIKTQPLYKSELETERYGNHVINGSYPPPLKIFRVKYIWADYYVLHLSQQP